ncbi:MAG: hypothetical protein ACLFNX_04715 [Spirochaetaceae bacterium]
MSPRSILVRVAWLLGAVALIASCGDVSLYSLLESEEGGEFSLGANEIHLQAGNEYTITAKGGFTPYHFELDGGVGELQSSTGHYTAPSDLTDGEVVDVPVKAADSMGETGAALIRLYERLSANPNAFEISEDDSLEIEVGGGIGEYEFEVDEGSVVWDDENGELEYTAPETAGSDSVRVYDEIGNRLTVDITVYTESGGELHIAPSSRTLVLENPQTVDFDILGGTEPYVDVSVDTDPGDLGVLDWDSGDDDFSFTLSSAGTAVFTVEDSDGATAEASLVAVEEDPEPLVLSPSSVTVSAGGSAEFSASGGVPPYEFTVDPGAHITLERTGDDRVRANLKESLPPPFRDHTWELTVTDAQGQKSSSNVRTSSD